MKSQYKLLVTDIDGTIANKDGEISDIDLKALRKINKAGVMISLCTGRPAGGCAKVLDRLSMDGFHIFFDGALVTDSTLTEEIYIKPIGSELVKQICTLASYNEITMELFSKSGFFISSPKPLADIHGQLLNFKPIITDFATICTQEKIVLGCLVTPAHEETRILSLFQELEGSLRFSSTINPTRPDIRLINITATGVTKGTALEALITYLGLNKKNVMAIGDGANDITLLSSAGLAIAMKNAPENLKNIANYVTEDVEHNGVAKVIKNFFY
jgi:hypothetical protein